MTSTEPRSLTFTQWIATLSCDGYDVLAASHAVPVQLWLREPGRAGVLHFLARGTRLTLRRYDASDLTALILRSECDCAEHRTAGADVRTVLRPGAEPLAEAVFDGSRELGWRGHEAGLVDVAVAAEVFAVLHRELAARAAGEAVA